MKKILLSLFTVLCFTLASNAQCINTGQFPNNDITVNNDGNPNDINTCVFTGDFSQLVNVIVGDDYLFTLTANATGTRKYITVTDGADAVIAHGESPLTVLAITSSTIRVHYTEDAACNTEGVCHTATYQNVSACVAPNSLSATPTDSTAQLSWSPGSIETTWEVEVVLSGTTPTGSGVTVNAPSYTATGLTANTNYDFYVRSDCGGGDFSIWVGPSTFLTLPTCPATGNPFLNNLFNDGAGISWFPNGSESMWDVEYGPTGFVQGTGTLVQGLTTDNYLISGQMPDTTYDAYVRAVCDGNDLSPWSDAVTYTTLTSCPRPSGLFAVNVTTDTATISWLEGQNETMWELEYGPTGFVLGTGTIVTTGDNPFDLTGLDPDTAYDIYVRADCGGGDFSNPIGPETFTTLPTCPQPTDLVVNNILTTTADISWTPGLSETDWEIEYGPTGFVQGTGTLITTTDNPYSLTGLDPATTYDVYVRADCGATDGFSQWVGPLVFTTECVTFTAPYTEGFENGGAIPNCWLQGSANVEDWLFENDPTFSHIGNNGVITGTTATNGYFAYVDDSFPDNVGTMLTSPLVDVSGLTSPSLSFYIISNNEGNSNVTLNVDFFDGAAWNNAVYTSNTNTAGGWAQVFIDLSVYTITGDVQARFVVNEPANGDFYDDVAIDDVTFDELPDCAAPTALTAANINSNSADLGWTAGGSEAAWEIVIQAPGTGVPTGAGTATTDNPYAAEGLTSDTVYEFYVRANCGSEFSAWVGPIEFRTTPEYCAGDAFVDSGTATGDYSNNENITYTICPENPGDVVYVNFLAFSTEDAFGGCFDGLTIYNGGDTSAALIAPPNGGDIWCWDRNDVPASGTGDLQGMTLISSDASGCLTFVFTSDGSITRPGWEAAVTCAPPPTCPAPSDVTVSAITAATADVSWTESGTATNWEVEYGPAGFVQGTGTLVQVTTNPYTLTGLDAATDYEAYVRADCSGGAGTDFSIWSSPATFATACATITSTYINDFSPYLGTCWEEGNDTDIATGPNNTDGAWGDDGFGNVGGTGSARINIWNLGDSDWIVSPTFNLSGTGLELTFKVALTQFANTNAGTLGSDDQVQLVVSENGGAWTNLMTWDATTPISPTGDDVSINLDAYNGIDVRFAFWATEGTVDDPEDNDFFIDDFQIAGTLGTNDLEALNFKYFPNPVKDVLTLVSQSENISNVRVMNLLGQTVLNVTPNLVRAQVDLSNLKAGAYLVNVTINNKSQNIRIIKN